MSQALQPYGPIQEVAQGLFCVDGEWFETAFRRRMTVIRVKDGSLVVHSAIEMGEADMAELDQLGPVRTIVVPNIFHDSDAPFYAARYPEARVYVPAKIRRKCEKRMRVTGVIEEDWPHADEVQVMTFSGTMAEESLFFHRASKSVLVTDMAFNVEAADFKSAFERRVFGKWNDLLDGLSTSKLTRYVFARDPKAVKRVVDRLRALDFDRVIVNHGKIVGSDGKRLLIEAYERAYGASIR